MAKILAFFGQAIDEALAEKLGTQKRCEVIRLWCGIKFETDTGLTRSYSAILDTGAHISLIPKRIWSTSKVKILTDHYVRGLIPKPECEMEVKVGEISGYLVDQERVTSKHKNLSYFAPTNDLPIVIGFRELLSKFRVCFNYPDDAWLEEKCLRSWNS